MTTTYLALVSGEILLDPVSEELLLRQITEPLMTDGKPSSQAFGPSTADKGAPSFSRRTKTTPKKSREWHNANAAKPSLGVWACSTSEVHDAGSRSVDDSGVPAIPGQKKAPGHCYVDYRHMAKSEERLVRSLLLAKALDRQELNS